MNSSGSDRPQRRPGFPIRTPSDQRLVGSSPRLNAASHVLHRPTMPRHPPCALTTQHTYNKPHTHTQTCARAAINHRKTRCSRPLSSSHTTPTPATHPTRGTQPAQPSGTTTPHTGRVCHPRHPTMHQHTKHTRLSLAQQKSHPQATIACTPHAHTIRASTLNTKNTPTPPTQQRECTKKYLLLRKEVIQPHLPVRLPCYDFVPIANPTFDSSLTSLGHWLRVLPTFMT